MYLLCGDFYWTPNQCWEANIQLVNKWKHDKDAINWLFIHLLIFIGWYLTSTNELVSMIYLQQIQDKLAGLL